MSAILDSHVHCKIRQREGGLPLPSSPHTPRLRADGYGTIRSSNSKPCK
jgi:hypothetical protein